MSGHGISERVVDRDAGNIATKWVGSCDCGDAFTGPTHEVVEDGWREHVWQKTGRAPEPWGGKENRWQPPVAEPLLEQGGGSS